MKADTTSNNSVAAYLSKRLHVFNDYAKELLNKKQVEFALELLQKEEQLIKNLQCNNEAIAGAQFNLYTIKASGYKDIKQFLEALKSLEKAIEISKDFNLFENVDLALLNKCSILSLLKRHQEAKEACEEAAIYTNKEIEKQNNISNKAQVMKKTEVLGVIYLNIGEQEEYLGNSTSALKFYEKAGLLIPEKQSEIKQKMRKLGSFSKVISKKSKNKSGLFPEADLIKKDSSKSLLKGTGRSHSRASSFSFQTLTQRKILLIPSSDSNSENQVGAKCPKRTKSHSSKHVARNEMNKSSGTIVKKGEISSKYNTSITNRRRYVLSQKHYKNNSLILMQPKAKEAVLKKQLDIFDQSDSERETEQLKNFGILSWEDPNEKIIINLPTSSPVEQKDQAKTFFSKMLSIPVIYEDGKKLSTNVLLKITKNEQLHKIIVEGIDSIKGIPYISSFSIKENISSEKLEEIPSLVTIMLVIL